MKRFFFLLSAVVVSLTMAAQMQVWSNGTIIFSHDQADVDSISFGSPMKVQANYNALSSTSLAGSVYASSLAGAGSTNCLRALFFLDESTGYYGYNYSTSTDASNKLYVFTYTISGCDITLRMSGETISGKIIGKNGLVFSNFFNQSNPHVFVNINR